MSFRRRFFQQNRSKSAAEIATDFLRHSRSQDSPKTPPLDRSRLASRGSPTGGSPKQHRFATSPLAGTSHTDDVSIVIEVSSGAGGLDPEQGASEKPTSTSPSPPKLPSPSASVTSLHAERNDTDEQQQQQETKKSWRKVIFDRVCTTVVPGFSLLSAGDEEGSSNRKKKSREVRARWRKATLETLLVLRLNKDESDSTASEDREGCVEHRLGYVELSPCADEVRAVWEGLLRSASSTGSSPCLEYHTLLGHVKKGVPRELRGMVWKFLALQQTCPENCSSDMYEVPYSELLHRFSAEQHAILIDLGRTFPGHPFFAKPLGSGQVSLFNLLKAYSLLDEEVGYCQGVSFIAGLLLMHMEEEAAFEMIRHLMLGLGMRTLFCPSMAALQMKLYQLVRLLHDHDPGLYRHLERHEVVPALYATPWFLTLFASQYPLCFVARVFDLLFTQGGDVIFKVALALLTCHRELILQVDCFEELADFLKTGLPEMARIQSERVTARALELDISQELHNYEIEFHVFRDEMLVSSTHHGNNGSNNNDKTNSSNSNNNNNQSNPHRLQWTVVRLQEEKRELAEQLERAHSELRTLNMAAHRFRLNEDKFKARIKALELERAALLSSVSKMRAGAPDALHENRPAL